MSSKFVSAIILGLGYEAFKILFGLFLPLIFNLSKIFNFDSGRTFWFGIKNLVWML